MPLTCNIDAKGKFVRLMYGLALLAVGAALVFFWAWPQGTWISWIVSLGLIAGGGFAVFESWAGWCVVRAMGFRTPI